MSDFGTGRLADGCLEARSLYEICVPTFPLHTSEGPTAVRDLGVACRKHGT